MEAESAADFCRDTSDDVAECHELGSRLAAFVEGRVVVVAGGVRLVVAAVAVGAVHEAEAGAAMKHVHADGVALAEHPLVFGRIGGCVGDVVVFAPVIEPAGPVFTGHEGAIRTESLEFYKFLLRIAGTEVDDGGKFRKRAFGKLVSSVGGVEQGAGRGEAGVEERGFYGFHVGVVITEGTVFVLDLDGDDGTAILNEKRANLAGETREPVIHGSDVFRIGGPEREGAVFQEPGGIAAELPLGADVGAGTEDDVEAFLLSFADVFGNVVLAGEVVDTGAWFVEVPEDVGGDGVQAHGAGHAEAGAPVSTWNAGIVHFAGENLVWMAIELELAVGDGEGVRRLSGQGRDKGGDESKETDKPIHGCDECSAAVRIFVALTV